MDLKGLVVICQLFSMFFAESTDKSENATVVATQEWLPGQQMCPGLKDKILTDTDIPWGTPGRAYLTIPPEIDVYRSNIPKAGLGTFATTFIAKHTWLAEYEGITVLPQDSAHISWYAWTSFRGEEVQRYIDAGDINTGGWTRFVNMANSVYDENVAVRECYNKVYYQTIKDIYPGQELLINYGDGYAKSLGIFEELELSEALRSAELASSDDTSIAQVALELKNLMGLTGKDITRELWALLKDENSALSRTFGDKLKAMIKEQHLSKLKP